jgi:hypothetical protein
MEPLKNHEKPGKKEKKDNELEPKPWLLVL